MTGFESVDCKPGLRSPDTVMRLARMGASHPTRLSFMRQLIRNLHDDRVQVRRVQWDLDRDGYGDAVYSLEFGGRTYSMCAFTAPLDSESRTDRVIAEAWDATFVLYDGPVSLGELDRLRFNVARQEAGRFRPTEIVISRANKSVRMFEHVVGRLAAGQQPDVAMIRPVGYLMRTTAVYGNGKFGLADRCRIAERPGLSGPFQAELLTVWLIRGFSHELVEHLAWSRSPAMACGLGRNARRSLGIGNATGLGMAPFVVGHPALFNNWVTARETALLLVRAREVATEEDADAFHSVLGRAIRHVGELEVEDRQQTELNGKVAEELDELKSWTCERRILRSRNPWEKVFRRSSAFSLEGQELLVAALLEPHGALIDGLGRSMVSDREFELDHSMTVREIFILMEQHCGWAEAHDFTDPDSDRIFWYYSEEKMEPRIGDRYREPGEEMSLPLDVARQFQRLRRSLERFDEHRATIAEFLATRPELRHAVRRVQNAPNYPYAEIRDNLIGTEMRPIDILRCKLAFFGATKFDPRSDLWTRITMYQGAPDFETIRDSDADDWSFPTVAVG